jgi:histidinol-phosphate/aromatic aminotransferase/cobyric acid decarboxylase-like protein
LHDQAVEAIAIAQDGLSRVLGVRHPYSLAAAMIDAVLRADEGDLERAPELEARTTSTLTQTLGSRHPDTLRSRANFLLTRRQRGEDTTEERDRVIALLSSLLGEDHPTIATLCAESRVSRAIDPQPF